MRSSSFYHLPVYVHLILGDEIERLPCRPDAGENEDLLVNVATVSGKWLRALNAWLYVC